MFEHVRNIVSAIEADTSLDSRATVLRSLRRVGLDDFAGLLWTIPNTEFPRISSLLPTMVSSEVQTSWTGAKGEALLLVTSAFVRAVASHYARLTGRAFDGATMLDFGCGYGRIARFMYYFSDPDRIFGVDPWDQSIELCRESGLGSNFILSDYLPRSLPVPICDFSLIYAFSVFTHLSQKATVICLRTLRKYIADHGLLVITIRPVEYWQFASVNRQIEQSEATKLEARHRECGFAFSPHNRATIEGDITYGDASMTVAWLAAHAPNWRLEVIDRSISDGFQICLVLRPA